MKAISVIIPIFNVQEYLQQCLDSLYEQIDDSVEVILVNDGSTDCSLAICKDYVLRYPETILVDKENGGLSDARNAGIEVATGEYVYYLDSDDWLAPHAIKTLYDFAIENHCEVVQGGFYYAYDDRLLYDNRYKKPFVIDRNQALLELIKNDYVKNFAWGKLYKADIVKRHLFPKGKFFEDSYWQHLIVHETSQYGIVPTPLYYYRQRQTGISGEFSLRNLDLLWGYEERLKFIQVNYPDYISEMVTRFFNLRQNYCDIAEHGSSIDVKEHFRAYKTDTDVRYGRLFKETMKNNLKFWLIGKNAWIMSLYNLGERINNRFFSKKLKKINYSSINERNIL